MSINSQITTVLNSTFTAVKGLIPSEMEISKPNLIMEPFLHSSIGVLIGMTGGLRGRLFIEGSEETISRLGEMMFGMPLSGEMLESFAAEFGNMLAGSLATQLSTQQIEMDITPPTVLVGDTKMYGFEKAVKIAISMNIGTLTIILMIES